MIFAKTYRIFWSFFWIFSCALMLVCSTDIASLATNVPQTQSTSESKTSTNQTLVQEKSAEADTKSNLSELVPRTAVFKKQLLQMEDDFTSFQDITEIQEKLSEVSKHLDELETEYIKTSKNQEKPLASISLLEIKYKNLTNEVQTIIDQISQDLETINEWMVFWLEKKAETTHLVQGLGPIQKKPIIQSIAGNLDTLITNAQQQIELITSPLLIEQQKAEVLEFAIHKRYTVVKTRIQHHLQHNKQTPLLFSSQFLQQVHSYLWFQTGQGFKEVLFFDKTEVVEHAKELMYAAVIFILLLGGIRLGRVGLNASERLQFISQHPFQVSSLVSLTVLLLIIENLTAFWFVGLVVLFLIFRLSKQILADTYKRLTLLILVTILFGTNFLILAGIPSVFMRLYLFGLFLLLFTVFFYFSLSKTSAKKCPPWFLWSARFFSLFLLIGLVLVVIGQSKLALFLFLAVIKSIVSAITICYGFVLCMDFFEVLLLSIPISLVHDNARLITRSLRPFIVLIIFLFIVIFILVAWQLFPTPGDALSEILGFTLSFGSVTISVGLILGAFFILYFSHCFSKVLETVMFKSIFTPRNIDHGVGISISKLMHYAIILIGFLFAITMLGFDMTKLTILGGALGIGIGFGLQAIVNNFASGLILLFERPIKLGDTIAVGDELGEVKELGLRATIVQTFDKAEIVIPNSDLVTGQVTNWTLEARQARVRVPVGVAYGSDVEKVREILLQCAKNHPQVLSNPEPIVLFRTFGNSSLDFELRAFISDFSDRVVVQSDLNYAINKAFADAAIEIPFPQNDLHVKTIKPEVVEQLVQKKAEDDTNGQ